MSEPAGEVLTLHVGETGVRVGATLWEALCLEHELCPDGTPRHEDAVETTLRGAACFRFRREPITEALTAQPRTLLVDTARDVIDEVRAGAHRALFTDRSVATSSDGQDAGCVFARAHNGVGTRVASVALRRLRVLLEDCDHLQTVQLFHSRGGGTGAGLTSLIAERMQDELLGDKVLVTQLAVNPTTQMSGGGSVLEPYNALLSTHALSTLSDCALLFDNSALLAACARLRVPAPRLASANHLMAQVAAALTACARHEPGEDELVRVLRSLVVAPELKFVLSSLAPLGASGRTTPDVATLTRQTFLDEHHLTEFHPGGVDAGSKYLTCALLYRGDVTPRDLPAALDAVQSLGRFRLASCPDLQVSLCSRRPASPPFSGVGAETRACAQLLNTTAVLRHWAELRAGFCAMWRKRAFVHRYVCEGLELGAFEEAAEHAATIVEAYRQAHVTENNV